MPVRAMNIPLLVKRGYSCQQAFELLSVRVINVCHNAAALPYNVVNMVITQDAVYDFFTIAASEELVESRVRFSNKIIHICTSKLFGVCCL